ncbi:MAG: M81 family metallopeptidase [Fimbriimonadaceae bacterium]|nr:M81 family metallopeptidase [Fimbriimonadaceae bacterium]
MPRVAVAQWRQETNTHNPNLTGLAAYHRFGLSRDPEQIRQLYGEVDELAGVFRTFAAAGIKPLPLLRAVAWSGGCLEDVAYERLSRDLLDGLRAVLPVDGVLLSLHGATAAVSVPDVAGTLAGEVRALVGPQVPLAVTLDCHANVTAALVRSADLVVGYHEIPHVDLVETGARAAHLLARRIAGRIRPVTALRKVPAILGVERASTQSGPLQPLAESLRAAEAAGEALDCGLYPVQPWLDVPGLGSSIVVTTDGDPATADRLADTFADRLWELRDTCGEAGLAPAEVVARVRAAPRWPVVIADVADATNSGAPGDSTILLRALLAADLPGPVLVSVVDPLAAQAAGRAGVGATLTLPIGGKLDPRTGPPLTLTGRVRAVSDGRYVVRGHGAGGIAFDAGLSVAFECGAAVLAVTSHITIGSHPLVYRSLGLDPARAQAVVVKSPFGFRHDYGPFAAELLLADCPGAASGAYRRLEWQHVPPLFPLVDLPDRHHPTATAGGVWAAGAAQ